VLPPGEFNGMIQDPMQSFVTIMISEAHKMSYSARMLKTMGYFTFWISLSLSGIAMCTHKTQAVNLY